MREITLKVNVNDKLTFQDEIDYIRITNGEPLNLFQIFSEGLYVRNDDGEFMMDTREVLPGVDGEEETPNTNYGLPLRRQSLDPMRLGAAIYILARKHDNRLTWDEFCQLPREEIYEHAYALGEHVAHMATQAVKALEEATHNAREAEAQR